MQAACIIELRRTMAQQNGTAQAEMQAKSIGERLNDNNCYSVVKWIMNIDIIAAKWSYR